MDIFYSNIAYLNGDTLLPITSGDNGGTHLQNIVRILSTFQAWINLDFGISTCFFHGYDTYISTWLQFAFPLYIWLLVLVLIMASRYSSRVSNVVNSNIVSVLATLLLLSYAKLVRTSIDAFSIVQLQLLDGSMTNYLWKPNATITYLGRHHLPLFLISLIGIVAYVIPFTLLILLGPLLQAKSHYRVLSWINRLKPFHDAFYGPYTSRYRYWPGVLLLTRLLILVIFAFYTPNDIPCKLLIISVMAAVLLCLWIAITTSNGILLSRKRYLNYLELFFHTNLLIFAAVSVYTTQFSNSKVKYQQGLAVAMVGSVLIVFCVIIGYQTFYIIAQYKIFCKPVKLVLANIKQKATARESQASVQKQVDISTTTTCSVMELEEHKMPNNELREPQRNM
jgi:hypothetical protein